MWFFEMSSKNNMSKSTKVPVKFELSAAAGGDRYIIDSGLEIVFILRTIMQKNTLVSLYFDQGNNCILTSILDIDAERGKMVLDFGANEEFNRQALTAKKLVFVTSENEVKVQFAGHSIEEIQFGGRSAFSVGIPESLLRIQRREYFRITTPAVNPLKCTIPLSAGAGIAEVALLDISCGGIGVMDHHPKIDFEPGVIFENCAIVLPGIGTLNVTVRVRTTFEDTLRNGFTYKRAGCEFVAAPENVLAMIQRYIIRLERERNARQTGLG